MTNDSISKTMQLRHSGYTISYYDRAFRVAAARLWKSSIARHCCPPSLSIFR